MIILKNITYSSFQQSAASITLLKRWQVVMRASEWGGRLYTAQYSKCSLLRQFGTPELLVTLLIVQQTYNVPLESGSGRLG